MPNGMRIPFWKRFPVQVHEQEPSKQITEATEKKKKLWMPSLRSDSGTSFAPLWRHWASKRFENYQNLDKNKQTLRLTFLGDFLNDPTGHLLGILYDPIGPIPP